MKKNACDKNILKMHRLNIMSMHLNLCTQHQINQWVLLLLMTIRNVQVHTKARFYKIPNKHAMNYWHHSLHLIRFDHYGHNSLKNGHLLHFVWWHRCRHWHFFGGQITSFAHTVIDSFIGYITCACDHNLELISLYKWTMMQMIYSVAFPPDVPLPIL